MGASYKLGAFSTALVVDTIMNGNDDDSRNTEDSLGVSGGASYDLGVTKPMILVQYGKNENKLGGFSASTFFDEYVDDESIVTARMKVSRAMPSLSVPSRRFLAVTSTRL